MDPITLGIIIIGSILVGSSTACISLCHDHKNYNKEHKYKSTCIYFKN